jgi:hypothetical protein
MVDNKLGKLLRHVVVLVKERRKVLVVGPMVELLRQRNVAKTRHVVSHAKRQNRRRTVRMPISQEQDTIASLFLQSDRRCIAAQVREKLYKRRL